MMVSFPADVCEWVYRLSVPSVNWVIAASLVYEVSSSLSFRQAVIIATAAITAKNLKKSLLIIYYLDNLAANIRTFPQKTAFSVRILSKIYHYLSVFKLFLVFAYSKRCFGMRFNGFQKLTHAFPKFGNAFLKFGNAFSKNLVRDFLKVNAPLFFYVYSCQKGDA